MSGSPEIFVISILLCGGFIALGGGVNLRPKVFKIEKLVMCPGSESMPLDIQNWAIKNPSLNKFLITGDIKVRENITGDIKLIMDVSRCNLDMSHCEKYDRVVVPKLCDKINDKSSLWAPMTKMIKPRMRCPLTVGEHTINNGTFDLNLISRMPIDGYRWIISNRVVSADKSKQNRTLLCVDGDVSVTASKRRN